MEVQDPKFNGVELRPRAENRLRASAGSSGDATWYARQGIITPEMEFIAIRENLGREIAAGARALDRDRSAALAERLKSRATICIFRQQLARRTIRQLATSQTK